MPSALFLTDLSKALDRTLPVQLSVQLKGLIEYGIACGELPAGTRLPSVRELAGAGGIAAMTVSTVYKDLQNAGLIVSRPGSGNFVAAGGRPDADLLQEIHAHLDAALAAAAAAGLAHADVAGMLNARIGRGRAREARALRLTMVGIFQDATEAYADDILTQLRLHESIGPITIDAITISALEAELGRPCHDHTAVGTGTGKTPTRPVPDLYVTMVNRKAQLEAMVGGVPVVAISFIPSEQTRARLASIDPLARIGLVSVFPEFLALMKPGVMRFAPHVPSVEATLADDPGLADFTAAVDLLVFATGAEAAVANRPAGMTAIEYRHKPDPHSLLRQLVPAIERLQSERAQIGAPAPSNDTLANGGATAPGAAPTLVKSGDIR